MRKSIQQMLMLSLCAMSPSFLDAATLSVDEAKDVAAEFFQSGEVYRLADKDAFVLAHTATDEASNPLCYVFNAKDGKGFVIVSADESSIPVIGYSDNSIWSVGSFPAPAERVLLEPVKVSADVRRRVLARASAKSQNKLLATPSWSQEAPFNNSIPNRRLTGCVGIALAEILKYHNYPASRPASLVNGGESTVYDWNTMRMDNYRNGYSTQEAAAVATLVADASIGIGTDFGMSSSSAYEVKVPYALTSLFGYDAGVSYKKRQEMSRDAWDQVIVDEIDNDRPVLYCGQDVSAGHAFVCDGYEMRGSTPYFHINWGWGGSANGYYASDALNPVVSKAHHYNDLMTIVYNIKPAANNTVWSDIHITSDSKQVGLTLDVADITSVPSFTVRAGALKNISNTDFNGKLSVALFGADGKMKCLLNDGRNFSLVALQIMSYLDFLCSVPAGTSVADGDVVRLVAQPAFSTEWLPVAGDLLAPGEVKAKGNQISYFTVSIPASSADVDIIAAENKVIKGRDYSFTVVPKSVDKVITVKANGFILTPDANNGYRLANVLEDQKIDVLVQNASDVLSKSTLWVTAGNLQNLLSEQEAATVVDLTLFGTINVNDFNFMRDRMKLQRLDLSQVSIVANGSNPANAIPTKAFMNCRSLKQIILPNNLTTFKNGCLAQTGLTSIEVPASVGTWEYNVFVGCNQLREVIVRRSSPAWINWCVFNGTPKAKLVVPVGATAAYKSKEYWQEFKEIVEENPVPADLYKVTLQEKKGLRIYDATEGTEFAPGTTFSFKVDSDDTYGNYNMEVYANADRLYPDASGVYSAKINRNTLLHVEFKAPQPTGIDDSWKITGAEGGVGLVSEVVNVPVGQAFNVRVNAIKVPSGYMSQFFAIVLTDKDGNLKEVISTVMNNLVSEDLKSSNIVTNFNCKVKESVVREGDMLRLATSASSSNVNRKWNLVEADAEGIVDRLSAVGNQVPYHVVNLPQSTDTYKVEGQSGNVVRGMPYSFKVTPVWANYRVTVTVNGVEKASNAAVANISIPAVTQDLDIKVACNEIEGLGDAEESGYVVVNVQGGQLASKMNQVGWPEKLKLVGSLNAADFTTFQNNCAKLKDLDLSDVTVPNNDFPGYAFYSIQNRTRPTLRTLIMPKNVTNITSQACIQCTSLTDVVLPPALTKVGAYAFSSCIALNNITIDRSTTPSCDFNPFPNRKVTLYVPSGAETAYKNASYWSSFTIKAIEAPKTYYWVNLDATRLPQYGQLDLDNVGVGKDEVVAWIALPNLQRSDVLSKVSSQCRYGVPFKLYDNGVDMYATYPDEAFEWSWNSSNQGGVYKIYWNPNEQTGRKAPDNHKLELFFYYPISFKNNKGAEKVKASIVNLKENEEWKNIEMWRFGGTGTPTMYKEGSDIQFTLSLPDTLTNSDFDVMVVQKVMTKSGLSPEYEHHEYEVEAVNGVYTIPSIAGETSVTISPAVPVEDDGKLSADELLNPVEDESTEDVTMVTLVGEIPDEAFDALKENYNSVEYLDLSEIDNTSIPEGAFAGMENLQSVTVPPTVTEIGAGSFKDCDKLESISLPGVTSIGEGAFEGCDHLTSILLPSIGANQSVEPAERPAARRVAAAGLSADAFNGLNPNCLIYIGDADIPNAESLNLIMNVGNNRIAASDIAIDGNHPFNAPASFCLGENKISMTIDVPASVDNDVNDGWTGIILPFQPTGISYGEEFAERVGSGIHLVSFDNEDSETMTPQSTILPNRPYLANVSAPFEKVAVTFYAEGMAEIEEGVYDVPYTPVPEDIVSVGKDFSLYGSYDGQSRPVVYYALNEDASKFIRPVDSENETVAPFTAYVVANEGVDKAEMVIGEHPLWIYDPASVGKAGTALYRSDKIDLASASSKASIFYTLDGSDPTLADGSRKLFEEPFVIDGDNMTLNAVAEYKGNLSDVVTLNFSLKKVEVNFDLAHNWNWISHNMENAVAIEEFATEGIDAILSQTQEVVRDAKHGLVGSLKEISPSVGYKVSVADDSWTGKIAGIAFDPIASVQLKKGWNWIGSTVDDGSLLISDLLAALEVEEGEMLVGLDGFVQADADGVWKGTLSKMLPGVGYMYFSNSDKEFTYTITPAHENAAAAKAPVIGAEGFWSVDNHKYASVMPIVAELVSGDTRVDAEEYEVAAFCGDECRGIGVAVDGLVMINIHGNEGDQISFRFIDDLEVEKLSSSEMIFEDVTSTFAAPVAINIVGATAVSSVSADEFTVTTDKGSVAVKGDTSSVNAVEVYDVSGVMIAKSLKSEGLSIENLAKGVVTVVVRTANGNFNRKMLVK